MIIYGNGPVLFFAETIVTSPTLPVVQCYGPDKNDETTDKYDYQEEAMIHCCYQEK